MINIALAVTNTTFAISFVLTVVFGIWVYLKSSRKMSHIMFLLTSLAVSIFQISHVIGINSSVAEAAQSIFMLNIANIFIACFNLHWILAVVGKDREKTKTLIGTYVAAVGLTVFYLLHPDAFLSAPKSVLYFPNYYSAGPYYFLMLLFFAWGFANSIFQLISSYRVSDNFTRRRLMYFIISISTGFVLGSTAFPLVYGIELDPIYSTLFSLYIVPLAYGILKYDLMDVKVVAKRAFLYAVFVGGVSLAVGLLNIGNSIALSLYPNLPGWLLPLTSGVVAVLIGGFVWEKLRELDVLKYEFITVVTHKFRTPLTRIRWAIEMLKKEKLPEMGTASVAEVDSATETLFELTDMLVGLGKVEDVKYLYSFEHDDICGILEKSVKSMNEHIKRKNLDFTLVCPPEPVAVLVDDRRMQFALQIVIENAITYTPEGGKVRVVIHEERSGVCIDVIDSGMGIIKDDLQRVFTKFFRSREARTVDTEGLGIGLFMARQIVERHNGTLSATSEGPGKGSTFTVKLPVA